MPAQTLNKQKSYYELLGIAPPVSDEEVKRAYRRLAMMFHPDQNPRNRRFFEKRFRLLNEAYAALRTEEKRAHYDDKLNRAENTAMNDNLDEKQEHWLLRMTGALRPKGKPETNI